MRHCIVYQWDIRLCDSHIAGKVRLALEMDEGKHCYSNTRTSW